MRLFPFLPPRSCAGWTTAAPRGGGGGCLGAKLEVWPEARSRAEPRQWPGDRRGVAWERWKESRTRGGAWAWAWPVKGVAWPRGGRRALPGGVAVRGRGQRTGVAWPGGGRRVLPGAWPGRGRGLGREVEAGVLRAALLAPHPSPPAQSRFARAEASPRLRRAQSFAGPGRADPKSPGPLGSADFGGSCSGAAVGEAAPGHGALGRRSAASVPGCPQGARVRERRYPKAGPAAWA